MECVKFDTRNWRKINFLTYIQQWHGVCFYCEIEVLSEVSSKLLPFRSKPQMSFSRRQMPRLEWVKSEAVVLNFFWSMTPLNEEVSACDFSSLVQYIFSCEPTRLIKPLSLTVSLTSAVYLVLHKEKKQRSEESQEILSRRIFSFFPVPLIILQPL